MASNSLKYKCAASKKYKTIIISPNDVNRDESKETYHFTWCVRLYTCVHMFDTLNAARDLLFVGRWGVKIRTRTVDADKMREQTVLNNIMGILIIIIIIIIIKRTRSNTMQSNAIYARTSLPRWLGGFERLKLLTHTSISVVFRLRSVANDCRRHAVDGMCCGAKDDLYSRARTHAVNLTTLMIGIYTYLRWIKNITQSKRINTHNICTRKRYIKCYSTCNISHGTESYKFKWSEIKLLTLNHEPPLPSFPLAPQLGPLYIYFYYK